MVKVKEKVIQMSYQLSYDIFANKTQYKANLEQQYKIQRLTPNEPLPGMHHSGT